MIYLRSLSLFFIFLFSSSLLLAQNNLPNDQPLRPLDVADDDDATTTSSQQVRVESQDLYLAEKTVGYTKMENLGYGESSSNPIKGYIPIGGSSDILQHTVFSSQGVLPDNTNATLATVGFYVSHNGQNGKKLLRLAVQGGGVYRTIPVGSDPSDVNYPSFSLNASEKAWIYFRIDDLCGATSGGCTYPFFSSNDTRYILAYLYLASEDSTTIIDPNQTEYQGGKYIQIGLSSKVSSTAVTIKELKRGDARVTAILDTSIFKHEMFQDGINKILIQKYTTTDLVPEGSYEDLKTLGTTSLEDFKGLDSVAINQLPNGVEVNVAVGLVNRYMFSTPLSASKKNTPQEIEVFLREQSCFLLSAGFQTDHFVLDYFRSFRDNTLAKFSWGQNFISWYYQTAPHYAPLIYQNPYLSQLVRGVGYTLYFVFRYFPHLVFIPLSLFLGLWGVPFFQRARKKQKVKWHGGY